MRRKRRNWIRRVALGLAVAAFVAPAAQARSDEGTAAQEKAGPGAVIHGDDKAIVAGNAGVLDGGRELARMKAELGKDADRGTYVPIADDKVVLPETYSLAGYRHALPEDYGSRSVVPVGDDKVIVRTPESSPVSSPGSFDWGDALIGAGAAFGLVLLAGAGALGTRRGRPAAA